MSEDQKTANQTELEATQAKADAANKERSGVGTRVRVGQTRGRNPMVISWEAFDESLPATNPTSISNFMDVTSVKDEPTLVSFLITGFNDLAYTSASDPLKEYVDASWSVEVQNQFRLVVRNYSRGAGVSLEDAVALIKPGFSKSFSR